MDIYLFLGKWSGYFLHDTASDLNVFELFSNILPPGFCCQCLLYTYSHHQKEESSPFHSHAVQPAHL